MSNLFIFLFVYLYLFVLMPERPKDSYLNTNKDMEFKDSRGSSCKCLLLFFSPFHFAGITCSLAENISAVPRCGLLLLQHLLWSLLLLLPRRLHPRCVKHSIINTERSIFTSSVCFITRSSGSDRLRLGSRHLKINSISGWNVLLRRHHANTFTVPYSAYVQRNTSILHFRQTKHALRRNRY